MVVRYLASDTLQTFNAEHGHIWYYLLSFIMYSWWNVAHINVKLYPSFMWVCVCVCVCVRACLSSQPCWVIVCWGGRGGSLCIHLCKEFGLKGNPFRQVKGDLARASWWNTYWECTLRVTCTNVSSVCSKFLFGMTVFQLQVPPSPPPQFQKHLCMCMY